ncbi:MAG: N-acetylmuramoyl-L-alanine amidase, partial [Tannerellaceae bacterium]
AFNKQVANDLKNLDPNLYDLYHHNITSYYKRQQALADQLNKQSYDLVIELHFNDFNNPNSKGTVCLYCKGSKKGQYIAETISQGIVKEYGTDLRGNQGCCALTKTDRGGWFTFLPKAPAVIIEPFFASNDEALKFKDTKKYAETLHNILTNINF